MAINNNQGTSGTGTEAIDCFQAEHQVLGRPPGLDTQIHLKLIQNPWSSTNVTGRPHTATDQVTTPRGKAKCPIKGGQPIDPGDRDAQFLCDVLANFLCQIAIPVLDILENGQNGRFLISILFKDLVYLPQFHYSPPVILSFILSLSYSRVTLS